MSKKILIVDDCSSIRLSIGCYLKNKGFDVEETDNGENALKVFNESYDLLITDLLMPQLNGLSLIRKIRELGSNIPVIVITTDADEETHDAVIRYGANEILRKPFSPDMLLNMIYRNLGLSEISKGV